MCAETSFIVNVSVPSEVVAPGFLQGFVEVYKGRETRHRVKNLAHATEYQFRLKVGPQLGRLLHLPHETLKAVTMHCKKAQMQ